MCVFLKVLARASLPCLPTESELTSDSTELQSYIMFLSSSKVCISLSQTSSIPRPLGQCYKLHANMNIYCRLHMFPVASPTTPDSKFHGNCRYDVQLKWAQVHAT